MPAEPATAALAFVAGVPFHGAPEALQGTTGDLLLVATGRPAGLAGLSGGGVARLSGRLRAPAG